MTRKSKIILVGSITALLLAVNYWQPNITIINETARTISNADYYFETVSLKQFDQQGRLSSELNAEKMEHFNATDTSDFVAPKILFLNEQDSAWQVSSRYGRLNHQVNELVLKDNAEIRQVSVQNQDPVSSPNRLKTNQLSIDLSRKLAITESAVTIETGNSQTHAVGMQADFDKETIHLLEQVETRGINHDSK